MLTPVFKTFIDACRHSKDVHHKNLYIIVSHLPVLMEECAKEGKMTCTIRAKDFGLPDSALNLQQEFIRNYLEANGYRVAFKEVFIKEYHSETELHIYWNLLKYKGEH